MLLPNSCSAVLVSIWTIGLYNHTACPGYGLMVYAEEFRLRKNTEPGLDPCQEDYIEFGREDSIPLWTNQRSGRLCGTEEGVKYEVSSASPTGWFF